MKLFLVNCTISEFRHPSCEFSWESSWERNQIVKANTEEEAVQKVIQHWSFNKNNVQINYVCGVIE